MPLVLVQCLVGVVGVVTESRHFLRALVPPIAKRQHQVLTKLRGRVRSQGVARGMLLGHFVERVDRERDNRSRRDFHPFHFESA